MTTKQMSVGVAIDPAVETTLVVSPTSVTLGLNAGAAVPSKPLAKVSGGTPPYTCVAANPLPPGLTFEVNKNGDIYALGTPTATAPTTVQVLLDISDSAPDATGTATVVTKKSGWGK
jgi:hypothetical protein